MLSALGLSMWTSTGMSVLDNSSPRSATDFVNGVQSPPSLIMLGWFLSFVGDLFLTHPFACPFLFSMRLSHSVYVVEWMRLSCCFPLCNWCPAWLLPGMFHVISYLLLEVTSKGDLLAEVLWCSISNHNICKFLTICGQMFMNSYYQHGDFFKPLFD